MILSVNRGDRAVFTLVLNDTAGEPIDLTDLTVTFTAKSMLLDADVDAIIAKTNGSGIDVSETPTSGEIALILDSDDTEGLADATRLYWDIQTDDGVGNIATPLMGKLVVSADVTLTASATS